MSKTELLKKFKFTANKLFALMLMS